MTLKDWSVLIVEAVKLFAHIRFVPVVALTKPTAARLIVASELKLAVTLAVACWSVLVVTAAVAKEVYWSV